MKRHPASDRLDLPDNDDLLARLSTDLKLAFEFRRRILVANPGIAVNCYLYINRDPVKTLA
jgi:hypothetical protein